MTDSSEVWTSDSVAARFEEAARTGRTLPPVRVQGYFRVWPHIVREQWERLAADEQPRHYYPPSPAAIDRMLETMRWVQWLDVDHRHLVWMRAQGDEWQYIAKRYACCIKTAQRRWQRAMQTVVSRLNGGDLAGRE
ncbi:DUF6362 family protein [Ralstonia pseudosolanacearum]|uniref:DUF6362 family protein n=1 Tax=Ralstonia pseudosolanacearum TaxID=1310165 RepID=UPI003D0009FD